MAPGQPSPTGCHMLMGRSVVGRFGGGPPGGSRVRRRFAGVARREFWLTEPEFERVGTVWGGRNNLEPNRTKTGGFVSAQITTWPTQRRKFITGEIQSRIRPTPDRARHHPIPLRRTRPAMLYLCSLVTALTFSSPLAPRSTTVQRAHAVFMQGTYAPRTEAPNLLSFTTIKRKALGS